MDLFLYNRFISTGSKPFATKWVEPMALACAHESSVGTTHFVTSTGLKSSFTKCIEPMALTSKRQSSVGTTYFVKPTGLKPSLTNMDRADGSDKLTSKFHRNDLFYYTDWTEVQPYKMDRADGSNK